MLTIQSSTADGALILVSAAISMINIGAAVQPSRALKAGTNVLI